MAIQKAYKAVLSRGDDIQLDPNEIETVLQGASKGQFIRVRQGIINPSYLVSIVEDKERREKWIEHIKYDGPEARTQGMKSLKDIFKEDQKLLS